MVHEQSVICNFRSVHDNFVRVHRGGKIVYVVGERSASFCGSEGHRDLEFFHRRNVRRQFCYGVGCVHDRSWETRRKSSGFKNKVNQLLAYVGYVLCCFNSDPTVSCAVCSWWTRRWNRTRRKILAELCCIITFLLLWVATTGPTQGVALWAVAGRPSQQLCFLKIESTLATSACSYKQIWRKLDGLW